MVSNRPLMILDSSDTSKDENSIIVLDLIYKDPLYKVSSAKNFCDRIHANPTLKFYTYNTEKYLLESELKTALLDNFGEKTYSQVYPNEKPDFNSTNFFKDVKADEQKYLNQLEQSQIKNFYNPFNKNNRFRCLIGVYELMTLVGTPYLYAISKSHSTNPLVAAVIPMFTLLGAEFTRNADRSDAKKSLKAAKKTLDAYDRFKQNLESSKIEIIVNEDANAIFSNAKNMADQNQYIELNYRKLNEQLIGLYRNNNLNFLGGQNE